MKTHTTNPLQPTPTARHRFHLLDGLRGLAAVFVCYWHAPSYLWQRGHHSSYLAVDFFFCLSGFVVAFAYEQRLRESLNFHSFMLARLIRLYPIFVLAALLGLPAFFLMGAPHPIDHTLFKHLIVLVPAQLLMIPNANLYPDILLYPVLNPGWSLFFEVLASVGFGALVRLRRSSTPYLLALYVIALASMTRWAHIHQGVDVGWESSFKAFCGGAARVALSFTAGVLVQRFYRSRSERTFSPTLSTGLGIAIIILLPTLLLTPFAAMGTYQYQLLLLAFGFPFVVLLAAFCRPSAMWNSTCAFLGDISYPLYLFHYPCLTLLGLPWIMHLLLPHQPLLPFVVPAVIVLVAAFAYAAEQFYDIPVRKFLTRRLSSVSTTSN